jgi:hypothetical protein
MRILLQQQDTGLYFQDIGAWTADSPAAMDFVSSTAALDFCAGNKLEGVQVVLKFDEERCAIVLPPVNEQPSQGSRPSQSA